MEYFSRNSSGLLQQLQTAPSPCTSHGYVPGCKVGQRVGTSVQALIAITFGKYKN